MSQTVRRKAFGDAGGLRGLVAGQPDGVRTDGYVCAPALQGSREKIVFGFHPAEVDAQGLEQCWTEWHLAIAATFALLNANHHALAVDVVNFEPAQFRPPHGSGIQSHDQGAVKEVAN